MMLSKKPGFRVGDELGLERPGVVLSSHPLCPIIVLELFLTPCFSLLRSDARGEKVESNALEELLPSVSSWAAAANRTFCDSERGTLGSVRQTPKPGRTVVGLGGEPSLLTRSGLTWDG